MTVRIVDPPPTAPPKTITPLWTVTKDTERIDAELVEQGAAGGKLRILRNDEWLSGGGLVGALMPWPTAKSTSSI